MPAPCLYRGSVMHCRVRPFRHRFTYRVFSILLDLDHPDVRPPTRLFSIGRHNLLAWYPHDHGPRDGSPLRPWLDLQLQAAARPHNGRTAWLSCFPRMLGYGFNPLSIYFVYARQELETIVYEVKNTFGGQHVHVVAVDASRPIRHVVDKAFFVSPFIGMTARYGIRIDAPEERFALSIRETVPEGLQLLAVQIGERRPLSDRELLRAILWAGPLTFKVVAGIHWEALKLWWKGAVFRRPVKAARTGSGTARTPRSAATARR